MPQKTTQRGLCQAINTLTWRYRLYHLDIHRNKLSGKWNLDHLESRVNSIRCNVGAFVFTNGNVVEVYPKTSKYQHGATDSLRRFCNYVGMPIKLKTYMDSSFEGRHAEFQK